MITNEIIELVLNSVKGMNVDDAFTSIDKITKICKELILSYSVVSYPDDRMKEEER